MAPAHAGLSSNWEKLRAQINAEGLQVKARQRPPPTRAKPKTSSTSRERAVGPRGAKRETPILGTMGVTQSSRAVRPGPVPSLAIWENEVSVSHEDLVETYNLGAKLNSPNSTQKDEPNAGLVEGFEVGKFVAVDCEMVGVGPKGEGSSLARVSIVDFHGRQVYDSFVLPKEKVTDWRTPVSGVSPGDMTSARTLEEVQSIVAGLMRGRIVVGHDMKHDFDALFLSHPRQQMRDTAHFSGFKRYATGSKPSLRTLANKLLGVDIQDGQHSSLEDARAAMALFRLYKPRFDMENEVRFPKGARPRATGQTKTAKKAKKRRGR